MPSLATDLATLLSGISRPGGFHTFGTAEILAPGLEVRGIGPVALPLLPVQAEQLVAVATQAPYGRVHQRQADLKVLARIEG
ncbi:MAG: hypothetical protein H7Z12_05720 [Rhodospirillaceae bacterium]|nr:hypothetical protein [Rhodospirillales bacterium]